MSEPGIPEGLDVAEARSLIKLLRGEKELRARIDTASAHFLGRPYIAGSLVGSPDSAEVFTARLDGFDCVTYIETVLAFALSGSLKEFADVLRWIRYEAGQVDWSRRNHYMTAWVINNMRQGIVIPVLDGLETVEEFRTLSVVEGLPALDVSFRYFRKRSFACVRETIQSGDMVLFVSTKRRLDVFHTGLLFIKGGDVLMRHATRTAGKVIEQSLAEFLKSHRMSGFMLFRPLWQ